MPSPMVSCALLQKPHGCNPSCDNISGRRREPPTLRVGRAIEGMTDSGIVQMVLLYRSMKYSVYIRTRSNPGKQDYN